LKKPIGVKAFAIPGYKGHIPAKHGDSVIGSTFTDTTRNCFKREYEASEERTRYKNQGFYKNQVEFD